LFAVTRANELLRFNSATPGTIASSTPITGLQGGEKIRGIVVRPATGQLYALGSTSRLYTINPVTGAATPVGSGTFAVPLRFASSATPTRTSASTPTPGPSLTATRTPRAPSLTRS